MECADLPALQQGAKLIDRRYLVGEDQHLEAVLG